MLRVRACQKRRPYLYPAKGGTSPKQLLRSEHTSGNVDVELVTPSWLPDGSGFLFVGATEGTDWNSSILAYDVEQGTATTLLPAPADSSFYSLAISPDGTKIVYCLRNQDTASRDLHLVDVSTTTPTDTKITNDGKSCSPSF